MNIQVINKSEFELPQYQTENAAGLDLRANFISGGELLLKPLERALVPTGLYIELPEGVEAQIRPRSGLAYKHGITVLNSPGTIDADYRGEVKVLLVNLSSEDFIVNHGERIAQMVVAKHEYVDWNPVLFLGDTKRGQGGFGSSGNK